MKYTDNQRLKLVLEELIDRKIVYNQQDFCEKIGKNKSIISSFLTGNYNKPLSLNNLFGKVCQVFPFVNYRWLMYEEGEMFDENQIKSSNNIYTSNEINRAFDIIEQINKRHGEETRRFQDQIDNFIEIIKIRQGIDEKKTAATGVA